MIPMIARKVKYDAGSPRLSRLLTDMEGDSSMASLHASGVLNSCSVPVLVSPQYHHPYSGFG